ncbi:nucleotidyltransferase substrate binding protein [Dyadobacter chenhuakuii]|uniref:Nucleotidyltransferase substrate binding protein n=1 Tax=Dyadobacter chenhuakuii TaxID=2909339 RepID=A0ABY4XM24_9BACT|nr:nucleotidyltransferase substrate binding protein [Dyadobacter chenhuakuii]MCF2494356.1 nucleotidyltransferase substrate binding protein [Dyadobacter chenhuakuii]USJ31477.1 nucleotidyltransferase substrate binding protein [Dyadobacter chenhuakuii]
MDEQDIRWKQRFENYKKALAKLGEAVHLDTQRALSELERQGVIQAFEFTHELAWKVMQDFFIYQGNSEIKGSRDATRQAFSVDLIMDGDNWMEMIKNRNLTSHTYNEEISEQIYKNIVGDFYPLFLAFQEKMESIIAKKE